MVTVTTVWPDERLYYPVHPVPYTPARHFAKGKNDPAFRTKLAIGTDLTVRAREAGFPFRAVIDLRHSFHVHHTSETSHHLLVNSGCSGLRHRGWLRPGTRAACERCARRRRYHRRPRWSH